MGDGWGVRVVFNDNERNKEMTIQRVLLWVSLPYSHVIDLYMKQAGNALTAAVFASTFLALSWALKEK